MSKETYKNGNSFACLRNAGSHSGKMYCMLFTVSCVLLAAYCLLIAACRLRKILSCAWEVARPVVCYAPRHEPVRAAVEGPVQCSAHLERNFYQNLDETSNPCAQTMIKT